MHPGWPAAPSFRGRLAGGPPWALGMHLLSPQRWRTFRGGALAPPFPAGARPLLPPRCRARRERAKGVEKKWLQSRSPGGFDPGCKASLRGPPTPLLQPPSGPLPSCAPRVRLCLPLPGLGPGRLGCPRATPRPRRRARPIGGGSRGRPRPLPPTPRPFGTQGAASLRSACLGAWGPRAAEDAAVGVQEGGLHRDRKAWHGASEADVSTHHRTRPVPRLQVTHPPRVRVICSPADLHPF